MMNGNIEKEILKYLNDTFTFFNKETGRTFNCLKVLDNKYRKYYTGVTLNYICYNLLKAKYSKSDVSKVLINLYENNQLKMLYCPNVKKYVIENKKGNYGSNYYYGTSSIKYLEKFIKDGKLKI